MASSIPAPSTCDWTFCSTNCCEYSLYNETALPLSYTYTACTDGSVITTTVASSETVLFCASGTPDYNAFLTLDLVGCCTEIVSFQECYDTTVKFRFSGLTETLNQGETYYISGPSYTGYASIIPYEATGTIYSASGTVFTLNDNCPYYSGVTTGETWSYYNSCGDLKVGSGAGLSVCVDIYKDYSGVSVTNSICTEVCKKPALLYKCSDDSIFYGLVDEDTAFVGATYVYNGECYSFVEFSGPGGPDLGTPDFADCVSCVVPPTPTPINITPTPTPTITASPQICGDNNFCFRTVFSGLSVYNGNYTNSGTYNSKFYYVGDGLTTGYIYYNTNEWCLSDSLGGSCLLKGKSPCYSPCPDLVGSSFNVGICPTPTPSPSVCQTIDFGAYFECDWSDTPTPSVTASSTPTPTPTISVTPSTSSILGVDAIIYATSDSITPTPTPTPSVTPTNMISVSGSVTFVLFDQGFTANSVKVLRDCNSGTEYYSNQVLVYGTTVAEINDVVLVVIDNQSYCLEYVRDDANLSSNVYISQINGIEPSCSSCTITPTPTSSVTPTPTMTKTPTPTPTPSLSSNMVHVFQTCSVLPGQTNKIQIIQTAPFFVSLNVGNTIKDTENNCWEYLGVYPSSYIAPIGINYINYSGNYFGSISSVIFLNCESC